MSFHQQPADSLPLPMWPLTLMTTACHHRHSYKVNTASYKSSQTGRMVYVVHPHVRSCPLLVCFWSILIPCFILNQHVLQFYLLFPLSNQFLKPACFLPWSKLRLSQQTFRFFCWMFRKKWGQKHTMVAKKRNIYPMWRKHCPAIEPLTAKFRSSSPLDQSAALIKITWKT